MRHETPVTFIGRRTGSRPKQLDLLLLPVTELRGTGLHTLIFISFINFWVKIPGSGRVDSHVAFQLGGRWFESSHNRLHSAFDCIQMIAFPLLQAYMNCHFSIEEVGGEKVAINWKIEIDQAHWKRRYIIIDLGVTKTFDQNQSVALRCLSHWNPSEPLDLFAVGDSLNCSRQTEKSCWVSTDW